MSHTEIPLHVVFVDAWIKKNGKFLLAQRSSKDDQSAGLWAAPGGKVEMEICDEIVEEAIRREIREEVGVEITNLRYFASKSFVRSSGHHVISLSFLADYLSGEAKPLEDQQAVGWFTIEEMKPMLSGFWTKTLETLRTVDSSR